MTPLSGVVPLGPDGDIALSLLLPHATGAGQSHNGLSYRIREPVPKRLSWVGNKDVCTRARAFAFLPRKLAAAGEEFCDGSE